MPSIVTNLRITITSWIFWFLLSITNLKISRALFNLATKPQQWHKPWMIPDPEEKTILWIGENIASEKKEELYDRVRNADLILFWSHGGGMTFGKAAQNMDLFVRIIRLLTEKIHINVVVCATEYRLAPEYPFPAQLQDITAAYSHLIKNLNVDPKKVIMAGDSAGSLIGPDAIVYNQLYGKILGTTDTLPTPSGYILSSPVTSTLRNCASEKENRKTDFVPVGGGVDWVAKYVDAVPKNISPTPWAFLKETRLAEHSAKRVLVFVGGYEIKRDENLLCAETFKKAGIDTTVIQENYPHNWFCLGDTIVGDPTVMENADAKFAQWISQTLEQA
ncbi:hypothetical protein VKS41_006514 [Umbelopsis sp. WA50703]